MARLALTAVLLLAAAATAWAAEHEGQVTFGAQPVPGATVTATQGDRIAVTSTDADGRYRFAELADGTWTVAVEMTGFAPVARDVTVGADAAPATWTLTLVSFAEIDAVRLKPDPATSAALPSPTTPGAQPDPTTSGTPEGTSSSDAGAGFSRPVAVATGTPAPPPQQAAATNEGNPFAADTGDTMGAADGLLINGSVNNAAASPFAQPRAFGNARPGQRSLYNGMIGSLVGNSAWDARPFSFSTLQAPQPSYHDTQLLGTFGGPVRLRWLSPNTGNLFVGYQRAGETNAMTQSAIVPTALERAGDFSQSRDASGRPLAIVDPLTGEPFPGNRIPAGRISPQAAALLNYYPSPTVDAAGGVNYQAALVSQRRQDSIQSRWNQPLTNRSQLAVNVGYQRTRTDSTSLFGFEDAASNSGVDAQSSWFRRISQFMSVRVRYQFTRLTNSAAPFFANRTNVSGEAGIAGNNQDPENWGPPALTFGSGIPALSTAQHAFTRNQTHLGGVELFWFRGRHNVTIGGDARRHLIDIRSQENPRGTFAFTGAATGSDLADFLLGLPQAGSIAFGNADKHFRASSYDAYVSDDWRIGPSLTINLGVRWEFEGPMTERFGRLINLDLAEGFGTAVPVLATEPLGALTGRDYSEALMRPDWTGVQPRVAVAWRPIPGSSFLIRAGYGIYRNTDVYQPIARLLSQQPPLSTAFSVEAAPDAPLTLADGFLAGRSRAFNTFAVDPDFRVGSAQNWQVSAQRDLPWSLTVAATYLGARGSDLLQQILPNTYPAGVEPPCGACPSGFVYLTSNGRSLRNAAQLQIRRRLRNGLAASLQYTFAKAMDNASAFTGGGLGGAGIVQDWLDPEAEYGPSPFDQRHVVEAQVQYTTGAGIAGGTLVDGWKGRLLNDWTFTAQATAGSGLPLTPIHVSPVRGTGFVGTVRASTTGADPDAIPDGYYLNPAAYAPPAPGEWGTAGRNSIAGPRQFSLNASVARTFRMGERFNLDWRIDATNVLNTVTYAGVNTIVTSPQFGLPNRANTMRKIQSSLRLRF